MATYETHLTIPVSPETAFAFVSDFTNAVRWDPRTYEADRVTDGPIGVGTRFVLTGGLLKEAWANKLHIPRRLAGMPLPYDLIEFDPHHGFVLEGETRMVRYRDEIEFTAEDAGTRLRYWARLEFKGILRVGEPLLRLMFQRIGDDATRDLAATVVRFS